MLAICDNCAKEYSISFNASESKLLVVPPGSCRWLYDFVRKCTFFVGNNPIEYVDSFVPLGHVITSQFVDNDDILIGITNLWDRLITSYVS
jgi:hypothetical protein